MDIKEKLRAGHVKRWQVVKVMGQQTLAEHSFLVAILAEHIVKKVLCLAWSDRDQLNLFRWALYHDMPEVRTGDLNTLVKLKILDKCGDKAITQVEEGICDEYDELKENIDPITKTIVKIADVAEAIIFIQDNGVGSHANHFVLPFLWRTYHDLIAKAKKDITGLNWDGIEAIIGDPIY